MGWGLLRNGKSLSQCDLECAYRGTAEPLGLMDLVCGPRSPELWRSGEEGEFTK